MNPQAKSAFDLSDRLSPKADPTLIAEDDRHFCAIRESLDQTITDLSERLSALRQAPTGKVREVLDRDMEVHRLSARLRTLRRFGSDLCLGRMVGADGSEPVYVGRLGLTDRDGGRLLIDWRSPAAEPFFAATHADPMGLVSRRRYRWNLGRISDYWDEVFTEEGFEGNAALDDQSAFIASLGANRSDRMRDVLGTIQADQDAIIRAGASGALVVDGGPGTGKTVVALHRTAHLLYSDSRLGHRRGGVLFVGPHQPYLAYVADVLPSLGEEGVQTCTLRDLVPVPAPDRAIAGTGDAATGSSAAVRGDLPAEADPVTARLKSSAELVRAIEPAVRFYERPPEQGMAVATPWADLRLSAADWAEAFRSLDPGVPHNEAREHILDELVEILTDQLTGQLPSRYSDRYDEDGDDPAEEDITPAILKAALLREGELPGALNRAWPLLEPTDLVGDLWSVPAYLRLCAPWLGPDEVRALQRGEARAQDWTVSDLPYLDAARQRLGDPKAAQRRRRRQASAAVEQERMSSVIDNIIQADDDGEGLVTMLHNQDLKDALVDESALPAADPDLLAGPFAHIVVDEAQELTDAEWQMLLLRCPSRSFTIVGDRAQARHGFTNPEGENESWAERLERVGFDRVGLASLSINYRTPEEVMAEAEPVIREVLPDANVPTSVRTSGVPVKHGSVSELGAVLESWLAANAEGTACVIGDPAFRPTPRVRSLAPELVKGLEFDLVVLVDPEAFGEGIEGAVDRYVAMTRATSQLVILTSP
ncbi:RNA polymerase recycling motor ATPase HelR [Nocardiopsis metallicus]|uniref:RNA polymerase recycling motor ATPase HelR n=1 Tax=Nocardiopsis metallicus TaxID=179819 RepID=UPI0016162FBD|nr:RNA polymerase recycling motor ATPase HelR [Nocardiopsis metallicus]